MMMMMMMTMTLTTAQTTTVKALKVHTSYAVMTMTLTTAQKTIVKALKVHTSYVNLPLPVLQIDRLLIIFFLTLFKPQSVERFIITMSLKTNLLHEYGNLVSMSVDIIYI